MADLTSSLEADLFAALHASDSFSTTLPEPEHHHQPELQHHHQPELQHQPQPDPEKPAPTQVQPEPPQPSHETISARDQQTARDLATQSTHDLLASLNNAMSQPPPVTYTATAQDTAPQSSPKRERSPDMFDLGNSEKRLKTEGVEHGGHGQGETHNELAGFDMAAMLQNALGSFDEQFQMPEAPLTTEDTNEVRQQSSATASPVPEKVEHKIMKTSSNSTYVMRSMSLPVLGNVAVQLLVRLSQQSRSDTDLLLSDSESEFRQAYTILRDMFGLARKVFSDSPLLFPDELDISDSEDRETIRMSNLAATALSIFGVNDVTLNDIHESFFSIFVQEEGEYKEPLTTLLISLKTRLFINSLGEQTDSQHVSELLDRLFAVDMEQTLKLRSGDMALNSDEERLVGQIAERREFLARSAADEEFRKSLANQFSTEEFADNLSAFLQSHLGIVIEYAEKYGVNIPLGEESGGTDLVDQHHQDEHADLAALIQSEIIQHDMSKDIHSDDLMRDDDPMSLSDSLDLGKLLEQSLSNHNPELKDGLPEVHDSNETSDLFGSKDLAALISEKLNDTLDGLPNGLPNLASTHSHNGHETNNGLHPEYAAQMDQSHSSPYASYNQTPVSAVPTGVSGSTLPPHQSSPTSVLYERARQAAVAKSSNTARREGLHSTRRPWTPDEEKALMAGLDTVKGPHWSQILSLFGPNGTISDILKDRTQVQLKDKARNLKLFFLKTNSEMPFYLQSVTGELKTRAPSQAARKEAEEKARLNSEEEQARLQTIMTLAGGLQNNHHPIAGSPLAASSPARANSIAPGARNGTTVTSQGSSNSVPALAPMPISPMVKNEPADHHHISHNSTLPHIQPAPAPPLQPALKPHPPQIHHSQQQQHQQVHQTQSQPQHGQQQQQHHQQQQHQQQPQQHHQVQQTQPSHAHTPQQILPAPPPHHHTQPQQSPPAPANHQHQNFTLPPMPPNHHSTPDHQDAKLFEALQTAIAATQSTVSEPQAT